MKKGWLIGGIIGGILGFIVAEFSDFIPLPSLTSLVFLFGDLCIKITKVSDMTGQIYCSQIGYL